MLRWYLKIVLMLIVGFNVLIIAVSSIGGSANSYELAFAHCDGPGQYCGLFVMDVERGIGLLHPLGGLIYDLDWSPEGTRLAIPLVTLESAQTVIIGSTGSWTLPTLSIVNAWLSEDRLLYQGSHEQFEIYDFSTQSVEPFPLHVLANYATFYFVQISPDARYIAVNPVGDEENVLFVESLETSEIILRLNGGISEQNFSWSLDNQLLVYSVADNSSNLDIYSSSLITGETVLLVASPDNEYLARWSHHNQRLAYISSDSLLRYQLVIRDADRSTHMLDLSAAFTQSIGSIYALEWSPDDRYLLLQLGFVGGGADFYLVTTDGTDGLRRLTHNGNDSYPAWRP